MRACYRSLLALTQKAYTRSGQSELHIQAAPIRTRELSSRLTGHRRILGHFGASRLHMHASHNITSRAVFFQYNISSPLLCLWPSCHSLLGLITSHFIGEHIIFFGKSSTMSKDVHGLLRRLLHSRSEEIQAIKLQIQRKRSRDNRCKRRRSVSSRNGPRPSRNVSVFAYGRLGVTTAHAS